jgi:hypothetical protein
MKEGTIIVDQLNVFNTQLFQLNSMDIKINEKYKELVLLCLFTESWIHLVTSISFCTTYTLEFDSIVGALLTHEVRRKSILKTSTPEALATKCQSI